MCKIELTRSDVGEMMEGGEVRVHHKGETLGVSLSEKAKHHIVGYVAVP